LEVFKANIDVYFHQSFWNNRFIWSITRMHMALQNDKSHNTIMWYWCTWDTYDYLYE
jgi:hypothetical protein